MTKGKKFKKRVRQRMAQTGESYAAARKALEGTKGPGEPSIIKLCYHDLVPQGANDEELVCKACGFTKVNDGTQR
jgi:hypothetical protein